MRQKFLSALFLIAGASQDTSVLSSKMTGSIMWKREWNTSLIVLFIMGIMGMVEIGFKKKVTACFRSRSGRKYQPATACECLDFVEASHRHKVYPLMYCHMEITGHLDIHRLKTAIQLTSHYVPEILYTYYFKQKRFTDMGFTVDDAIIWGDTLFGWDLSKKPQLQITIRRQEKKDIVIVGISHILTDGEGFLQYLYLLAFLYNNEQSLNLSLKNHRELAPILKNIHIQKQTEQTRQGKRKRVPPLRSYCKDTNYFCLVSRISENDFLLLHAEAKKNHATLNDVFMTAYARVIARLKNIDTVTIPCPADLRRFSDISDELTIANMTGIYRRITIEVNPRHTFSETLSQVHIEMELQKSRYRCFAGIQLLAYAYHKIPHLLLGKVIEAAYRLPPVSYTNIGRIDSQKLLFHNCRITDCYITGTYRLPPDFQLSISTFQNVCTLNCTLAGKPGDDAAGQYILDQVKNELLEWAKNNSNF